MSLYVDINTFYLSSPYFFFRLYLAPKKYQRKKKKIKENYFLVFSYIIKNTKKSNIFKIS